MDPRRISGTWYLSATAVMVTTCPTWAVDGTPSWFESTVATIPGGFYASSPDLAFDHFGTPSVSWSQAANPTGTNTVHLSQLLGLGLWSTETFASGVDTGLLTALSFDRAERPTVSWVNGDGTVQASFNHLAPMAVGSGAATAKPIVSLAHDLAGDLRGLYGRSSTGNFFGIGYSGGSFSSGDLFTMSGLSSVLDAAIVSDQRGMRQVAARGILSGGEEAVLIASEPPGGGNWPIGQLATASSVSGVDIAIDPTDGRPALAYTTFDGVTTSRLFYSKFTGFTMQTTQILSSTTSLFEDVSLAFDFSDGRPAIAFERRTFAPFAQEVLFAYRDAGANWQTSLVDSTVSLDAPTGRPRRPSLAFDDYGTSFPAIAYVDSDGSLNVAFDPPVPEPATACLVMLAIGLGGARRFRGRTAVESRRGIHAHNASPSR